ncbi:MAG: hypothetical protein V4513_08325 [Pseudomonadota bacterium]
MRRALPLILTGMSALGACSTPGGPYPTLAPRAAEQVDPRVPVVRPINDRPVTAALAARLAELVAQAERGQSDFAPLADQAEKLAASAGAPQSDSWATAQEMLSAAVAARGPTARALGDIDAISADMLETQRGIAPNDFAAIQRAQAEVGGIDQRQSDRIKAVQRRLGI